MKIDLHQLIHTGVRQFVQKSLLNVSLNFQAVLVRQRVNLVDEHLNGNLRVDAMRAGDCDKQLAQCIQVVILSVQHENKRTMRALKQL